MSKSDDMLELVKQFANKKGYVKGLDTKTLSQKLGYNVHDINKLLFDLQKRGLLGFSTNKKEGRDGTMLLYRLRLTKQGIDAEVVPTEEPPVENEVSSFADEVTEQIGQDLEAALTRPATPTISAGTADATTPTPAPPPQLPPRDRYPTLVRLLDRKRLAEQAAMNLEALGADSLALQALELVDAPLTPLQKDITRFFVDHPTFVEFALQEVDENGKPIK